MKAYIHACCAYRYICVHMCRQIFTFIRMLCYMRMYRVGARLRKVCVSKICTKELRDTSLNNIKRLAQAIKALYMIMKITAVRNYLSRDQYFGKKY